MDGWFDESKSGFKEVLLKAANKLSQLIHNHLVRGGFHKAMYALRWKFALCAHPFEQIYSDLASCSYALGSTNCIFSQIWVRSMLNTVCQTFYEIQPRSQKVDVQTTLFYRNKQVK
jgi:hypothetical protein